jgi:hypothetical protein
VDFRGGRRAAAAAAAATSGRARTISRTRVHACTRTRPHTDAGEHTGVGGGGGGKRNREREREVGGIVVYLHASRYNTPELMPPTHRRHLRGLSYGDIFDRAIIPNTIYTARARRDARTKPGRPLTVRPVAPDRYSSQPRFVFTIRGALAQKRAARDRRGSIDLDCPIEIWGKRRLEGNEM